MKAEIDKSKKCLILKRLFKNTINEPWASISVITLTRFPSLVNEIGMIAFAGNHEFHLHETEEGFWALLKALDIESRLPVTWYSDVEAGKTLTIDL